MTKEEIRRQVGNRVTLKLTPQASGGPSLTGRLVGLLDAVDGLVLTVVPEGSPTSPRTIHYHHIETITPEP
ncbi:MAG TPA: hypothetical protein VIG69_01125 [Candidatus Methylomirabilis sp.]